MLHPAVNRVVAAAATTLLFAARVEAGPAPTCQGYENIVFCAELNGDCKTTSTDALIALKMAVGQVPATEAADLDNNGTVAAGDALKVLRIAVGSSASTLNCGAQYGVKATEAGFYFDDGQLTKGGYAVGWYANNSDELRNYLVFDVTNLPKTATSAKLHLSSGISGFSSPDGTETYELFRIDTPVDTLTSGGGVAAFNDLLNGTVLGELVANAPVPTVVDVYLNEDGIDYLNGSTGKIALGGGLTTLTKGLAYEYLFNSTNLTNSRHLIVRTD